MTLSDELFPRPTPETLALLAQLEALPALVANLSTDVADADAELILIETRLDALDAGVAELNTELNADRATWTRRINDLDKRVTALEGGTPPPPPDLDTVHVGPAMKVANTLLGWTSVQDQDHSPTTAAILAKCAHINNTHIIGFGSATPMQTVEGGPIDWSYLDSMFGYGVSAGATGYFPGRPRLRCVTLCGSPPYMRVPKPGTAPMPTGTPDANLYTYAPPHWSHHDNWAKLAAAIVQRYGIDIVHEWNEWKREWIPANPPAATVFSPPGSMLPIASTLGDRWAMEMHTDRYNHVYTAIKAVSPNTKVMGPYMVTRTYTDPANPDSATGPFPMDLSGPWGYGDKKAMQAVMYWIEHAVGIDAVCLDTKTSSNDKGILPEYEWDGLAKIFSWILWLNRLALSDLTKYGRAALVPLWFAEAYTRIIGGLTPDNHAKAVALDAWGYINHVLPNDVAGWMRWQPEGDRKTADPATGESIALWYAKGSPKSLQETEAVPVYAGLVEHFPPGTQLYSVTVDDVAGADVMISGIASDTTICLVSRSLVERALTFKGAPLVLAPYDVKFVPR